MTDHLHAILLLDGTTAPLPAIMQALKSLTTRIVPPKMRPLWQRSYHEHVIRDEGELEVIREYIRENPLAELIKITGG